MKRALRDLEKAGLYIARERPSVALHWAEGTDCQMRRVGEFPGSGRMVSRSENSHIREIIYHDVWVIYRLDPTELVVMIVGTPPGVISAFEILRNNATAIRRGSTATSRFEYGRCSTAGRFHALRFQRVDLDARCPQFTGREREDYAVVVAAAWM